MEERTKNLVRLLVESMRKEGLYNGMTTFEDGGQCGSVIIYEHKDCYSMDIPDGYETFQKEIQETEVKKGCVMFGNLMKSRRLNLEIDMIMLQEKTQIESERLWDIENDEQEPTVVEFLKICHILAMDPRDYRRCFE